MRVTHLLSFGNPLAFALTFRLAVLLVPVDKCGERERLFHEKPVQDSLV